MLGANLASQHIVVALLHSGQSHVGCRSAARPIKPHCDMGKGGALDLLHCPRVSHAHRKVRDPAVALDLFRVQMHGQGRPQFGNNVQAFAARVISLDDRRHPIYKPILLVEVSGQKQPLPLEDVDTGRLQRPSPELARRRVVGDLGLVVARHRAQ